MQKVKSDIILTRKEYTPKEEEAIEQGTPQWQDEYELDEEQKQRALKEMKLERDEIQKERDDIDLEERCDSADRQYFGEIDRVLGLQFSVHKHTTKVKVDIVTRHINQAIFDTDPIVSVTPRPEYSRNDGFQTCDNIQDLLDYEIDEVIPLEETYQLVTHAAVNKPVGWLKIPYVVRQERITREETYGGKLMPLVIEGEQPEENTELTRFLGRYENARQDYSDLVKDLESEDPNNKEHYKQIDIVADENKITYNAAYPTAVDTKNLYVRSQTKGYEGMCRTKLIEEDLEYTFWELKRMEEDGQLYDVDALKYQKGDKERLEPIQGYENKKYQITLSVFYFKENESDKDGDEIKLIIWRERDMELIIGSIRYPYYGVKCFYVPHWIQKTNDGIYQTSLTEFLTPSNVAEDAILNLMLQSVYVRNMFSPITKPGSSTWRQIIEKRWTWGMNLDADQAIDSVQNHMPAVDTSSLLAVMQYLVGGDDDLSGIASGMSGKADPVDPTAPASKTLALLERSGINIKAYIKCFVKSFNITANIILQLNYQMSSPEGRKFRKKSEAITGNEAFEGISRDDMAARVNIQSQALSFNFQKNNEKREDLALLTLLVESPIFTQRPESVYFLYKHIIAGWSAKWNNIKEKIWPTPDQFKSEQLQVAVQAIGLYLKGIAEARAKGQDMQIDPKELLGVMNQFMKEAVTPPSEQEVKAREKDAKDVDKLKKERGAV